MISTAPTVMPDTKSEAEVFQSISDPTAFAARLKALTDKSAEAAKFLEQVKAENQKIEEIRKQVEATRAATTDMLRQHLAKEVDIKAREDALAAREQAVTASEAAHAEAKKAFATQKAASEMEIVHSASALAQAKQEHEIKVAQHEGYIKAEVSRRTTALEAQLQNKIKEVETQSNDLFVKSRLAEEKAAAGAQAKAHFEQKLSQLKSLIS